MKKILLIFTLVFVLFSCSSDKKVDNANNSGSISTGNIEQNNDTLKNKEELTVTFISDKRNPQTDLDSFIEILKKQKKSVSEGTIKKLDFSDDSVKEYLKKNSINKLPAIIFSNNTFDTSSDKKVDENGLPLPDIKKYLTKMDNGEYYLEIGANYNPFTASDRGFSTLNKNVLEAIKNDSFFVGDKDKKIVWIEYSDLSCPYCQKFENSGIIDEVLKDYSGDVSKTFNHFIIHNGKHFEVLECMGKQKGKDGFFSLIKTAFKNNIHSESELLTEAEKLGANKEELQKCVSEGKYEKKIENQAKRGKEVFGIKSTPTSVFINTDTLEYKVITGFSESDGKKPFIDVIEQLK